MLDKRRLPRRHARLTYQRRYKKADLVFLDKSDSCARRLINSGSIVWLGRALDGLFVSLNGSVRVLPRAPANRPEQAAEWTCSQVRRLARRPGSPQRHRFQILLGAKLQFQEAARHWFGTKKLDPHHQEGRLPRSDVARDDTNGPGNLDRLTSFLKQLDSLQMASVKDFRVAGWSLIVRPPDSISCLLDEQIKGGIVQNPKQYSWRRK